MTQQAYDKIAAGLADITKGHMRVANAAEGGAQSVDALAEQMRAFETVFEEDREVFRELAKR